MRSSSPVAVVLTALGLCASAYACTETTAGPGGPGSASTADVSRCKGSCDKMKFFGCNSADEQARCYGDCDKATTSQIEIFTGCAGSSICDPACRTKITPADSSGGGSSGGGGTTGGGGATASSCSSACDKLVSCSLIPLGGRATCNQVCSTKGYQYQIDCVNNSGCDKIKDICGASITTGSEIIAEPGPDASSLGVVTCQNECDSLNFFECVSVAEHARCRDTCTTVSGGARDTFTSCSRTSGGDCARKKACFDAFSN
jgi:hypothetical protein